ncbi:hypothetical protein JOY44_19765 [Phormidium sp. CLA17]|uniref:hypothetical protein n=1 Tax=Leptolyngbya sp. Cla-17 TaxID=2803751 RepID=UPI001931374A|nr:hypothetical protein [Leptolyngbya sp. Cla-17]MBM0743828.1 hypothetical protein [Leptolyngbya sp. Cla-17]
MPHLLLKTKHFLANSRKLSQFRKVAHLVLSIAASILVRESIAAPKPAHGEVVVRPLQGEIVAPLLLLASVLPTALASQIPPF